MYTIEASKSNSVYKPVYINGRLKHYSALTNAITCARNVLSGKKNNYDSIQIKECGVCVAYVNKTITYPYFEIIYINKNEDSQCKSSGDRDLINSTYSIWKEKRQDRKSLSNGDSLNNLSSKFEHPFYYTFMSVCIEDALRTNNFLQLFKLEVLLSQNGCSWYPKDGEIFVDKTENVVDSINNMLI